MRKSKSVSLDGLKGYSNSVDELREALEEIPEGATFDIHHHAGDRPWESDTYSIEFNFRG